MTTYHTTDLSKLTSLVELEKFVARRWSAPLSECDTFEEFEQGLAKMVRRVECEVKSIDLARYDVDADVVMIDGKEMRKVLEGEPKTYASSCGPVAVARNLFRPEGGGKAVCPLELRAGIVGSWYTPALARQVGFLMGHMTSRATAEVFKEFGVNGPSQSSCDRLPKVLSETWERNREQWEDALRAEETVPSEATVVAVSLDGVLVPDRDAQQQAKVAREEAKKLGLDKKATGPAGYREVGCGTVSVYAPANDDDEKNKGPVRLDTVRYARAPEPKKKTLTSELDTELASILDVRPDLTLVALADGAEENWRYFEGPLWDKATKIVDNGHACEHLRAAMTIFYGNDSVEGRAEYERLRLLLRDKHGGVGQVISEIRRLERKLTGNPNKERRKQLRKERTYFANQRERMDYARYQALGLPIGSGVVEAACKTLVAQRLKLSGMSWRDGKQGILTIRSLQQSNRWERGWKLLAAAFRNDVARVTEHGGLRCITPYDNAA